MTNAEMHPIQVQDAPMNLQRTLAPRVKLLGERLVETTDRAGTGSHSHEGLGHFSHLVGARPSHKHLCEPLCNVRFIAAGAFKGLGVELAFPISGNLHIFELPRGGHQVPRVKAVAIAFALRAALSPRCSNELVELFTHHGFDHNPHRALSKSTQVVMEDLLFWEYGGRWVCG